VLGESKSDLSGENVDLLGSRSQEIAYSIYNVVPSSESDSDDDYEVFMVGQNDVPSDQTEEEIAQGATTEITRSKKLVKVKKKHMSPRDQNGDLASSDEEERDVVTSQRHHPKFDRRH
jgi:hypothetical protein